MKDIVIAALVAAGVPQAKAEEQWKLVVDRLCDGDEPTQTGFASLPLDNAKGFLSPMAAAVVVAVQGDLRAKAPGPAKRFKAGRSYTPREYVRFYVADPTNAELRETIARAVDGKPWLVAVDGKVYEAESALFIEWHMNEDVAPATVSIEGTPVAPIHPGEERPSRTYYVDPFAPGELLDVHMGSARTGASFAGYSEEALSAMAFLFQRHLGQDGNLSLNRLATEMRGRPPSDILAAFPATHAAWLRMKPEDRPAPKTAKVEARKDPLPFAAAPIGGRSSFLVYVVGAEHEPEAAKRLRVGLHPWLRRTGARLMTDADVSAGMRGDEVRADRLREAGMVVFLVSAATIAHLDIDTICDGRVVVPVIVRACAWREDVVLGRKVPTPRDGRPVGSDDNAWADVVHGVCRTAAQLLPT